MLPGSACGFLGSLTLLMPKHLTMLLWKVNTSGPDIMHMCIYVYLST